MKKKIQYKSAFSLMEMMVVLLIISIVAAATAPMISKKLARNAEQSDNPWVYPNLGNSVAFNMRGDNNTNAVIGAVNTPNQNDANHSRLYIQSDGENNHPLIAFGTNGVNRALKLIADLRDYDSTNNQGARVGISDANIPAGTVAFGVNQTIDQSARQGVVIGNGARIDNNSSVAIGSSDNQQMWEVVTRGKRGFLLVGLERDIVSASSLEEAKSKVDLSDYLDIFKQNAARIGGENSNVKTSQTGSSLNGTRAKDRDAVAIGKYAESLTEGTAIGANSYADISGTAVGIWASAVDSSAVAIGDDARAYGVHSIAVGPTAEARALRSTAIGYAAEASHANSVAIGYGAYTTTNNQIVLGTAADTVYIPGNLVVDGNVLLARNANHNVFLRANASTAHFDTPDLVNSRLGQDDAIRRVIHYSGHRLGLRNPNGTDNSWYSGYSDRRLKNVGKKFTGGLAELKKLDLYNYTFKKDEKKTPHVGVIAQDLQKVFPNAVTEGEDGYLRIRWDEMFYAVINAVKELDTKITAVVEQVKAYTDKVNKLEETITAQQETIKEQQKAISELKKNNADFEKRLAKLEKNLK